MSLPVFEGHAWDWDVCDADTITVSRGSRRVATLRGGYDPEKNRLYLENRADVVAGDVVKVRGASRRVVSVPQRWNLGTVVQLADLAAFLDVAELLRPGAGPGRWDYATSTYVAATDLPVWTGPCTITAAEQGNDATENAEQMVSVQAFDVEVPVDVVDVRPDDVLRAVSCADARLVGRRLTVTRVQAGSSAASRTFRAIDNLERHP